MENEEELRRFLRRIEKTFYTPPPLPPGTPGVLPTHIGHYLGGKPSPPPPSAPFAAAFNVSITQPPTPFAVVTFVRYAPVLVAATHGLIRNPLMSLYQPPPDPGGSYVQRYPVPAPSTMLGPPFQILVYTPPIAAEWFE